MMYLLRYLVVAWLVPREAAAVSAHVLCTTYNHTPVNSVTSCKDIYQSARGRGTVGEVTSWNIFSSFSSFPASFS